MTKITRCDGKYAVTKNGQTVAYINHIPAIADHGWPRVDHWALLHVSGRIDRFDSYSEARNDALKI